MQTLERVSVAQCGYRQQSSVSSREKGNATEVKDRPSQVITLQAAG